MKQYSLGVDIGGTKVAIVLGGGKIPEHDTKDFILDRVCFDTQAKMGADFVIGNICSAVEGMIGKHGLSEKNTIGIGISCGGPLDHKKGILSNPPNLYGWVNVPIVDIMQAKFGLPTYLQNDANACALAEWKFGAAIGFNNVIFLTFGTGLGAGMILNGKLYTGANGMAGEVGHVRLSDWGPIGFGKAGSFEGFCSGNGISQMGSMKVLECMQMGMSVDLCPEIDELGSLDAKKIAAAATKGDWLALEIFKTSGLYLGKGLSILIDILNPDIIVLGSIYERSETLLRDSMYQVINDEALERSRSCCKIVPALLGNHIGDFAALSVAFRGEDVKD